MENASKALIIAGAILIAILLISVGIIVMNSINRPIDQATAEADSQAVEIFNSKFTGYAGTHKAAAAVQSLLTTIGSSQTSTEGQALAGAVSYQGKGGSSTKTDIGEIQGKIKTGSYYDVSFGYATTGYINSCEIEEK